MTIVLNQTTRQRYCLLTSCIIVKIDDGAFSDYTHQRIGIFNGTQKDFLSVKYTIGRLSCNFGWRNVPRTVEKGNIAKIEEVV